MGMIRKFMSVSTMGLVDFRSDKERTAAYTRGARTQAKKQTKLMQQQLEAQQALAAAQQAQAQQVPAGWYPDPQNPAVKRYWDGMQWTQSVTS